ncbi:autophagy-related protein 2 homolog A-like [Corvus hawaiiensis]|uniref:autophagy-related protein 2 homolog A-like n=1 Tax=Corvus hawaiiensis TaxID=134902 RepID=UPI0020196104|nr:autophagy-related protein 2 homolog A-like [Corvus hawaiiensis]
MELHLGKVCLQHETYAAEPWGAAGGSRGGPLGPGEVPTSRLVLLVPELELRDRLGGGPAPPFLSRHPRGGPPPQPPTLWLKALRVLPHPPPPGGVPECCLRVTVTPLRLHIDQDALIFLRDFAGGFITHLSPPTGPPPGPSPACPGVGDPPQPEPPPDEEPETRPPRSTSASSGSRPMSPSGWTTAASAVTMEQGALAGILIGLARLNCSQLRLKRLCHRQGLLGLGRVVSYAVTEWLRDIRCHQLPGLLGGVAPVQRRAAALAGAPGPAAAAAAGGRPRGRDPGGDAGGDPRCHRPRGRLRQRRHRAGDEATAGPAGFGTEALYGLVAPPGPPRPLPAPRSPPAAPAPPTPPRHEERPRPHRGTGGAPPPINWQRLVLTGTETGSYWE